MAVVVRSAEGEVQVGAEPAGVARVGLAQRRTALEREDLEDALGDEMSEEEILGDVDKCCGSALSRASRSVARQQAGRDGGPPVAPHDVARGGL